MARSGLIVGLGGTGQWVLTWLKRDLLLSHNGTMPNNVRLLSVDTTSQLEAGAKQVKSNQEEAAVVGGIALEAHEFIHIGGDARPLSEEVRDGKFPQIGQWYQAKRWLSTQHSATFILDEGAGRLRQLGRLAVFKDLLGQYTGSKIWSAMQSAMEVVRANTSQENRLEIMVVGSFAGGTGSGTFLDIALILRLLAQQGNIHHVLRGFFALPSVFTSQPTDEMKARSFAAWRELNRFMVVDLDFPMPTIEYVQNNSDFRISPSQRIFDACYLVDGKRNGKPLAEDPKSGAFPMMAEAMSAMLDRKAGAAYTGRIFTNLAPEYTRRPEIPMYSAIGAYTMQVPAHYIQQASGHKVAQQILLQLLKPSRDPDKEDRLLAAGAERHLALAAPNRNPEDPGFAGAQRAFDFFKNSVEYKGVPAKPSRFTGRLGDVVEKATDAQQRVRVIDTLARAGGAQARSAVAAEGWLAYFPDLGDDPDFAGTRALLKAQMEYNVMREYGRRDKEKNEDFMMRINRLPNDLRTRFGGITASGQEADEYHGQCGDALAECQRAQLILFRRLGQQKLLSLLNGRTGDPLKDKPGKLGYTWDYFNRIVQIFDEFLKLMDDVQKRREELLPELRLAGQSKRAEEWLRQMSAKGGWLWGLIEDPRMRGAENEYLQVQQRLMDLRREDLLHRYVVRTAQEMRAFSVQVRDTLQRWVWHLATGDDAGALPGLWDSVRAGLREVNDAHSFDTSIGQVQRLLADEIKAVDDAELRNILEQWSWNVGLNQQTGQLLLSAELASPAEGVAPRSLDDPGLKETSQARTVVGHKNRAALLEISERQFIGLAARTTIAQEIKDLFPGDKGAEKFVNEIAHTKAEPLFEGASEASARVKSNLIRVQTSENDSFFFGAEGVVGELRKKQGKDTNIRDDRFSIEVVGSENPYKLTLVRTDDLYDYNHYKAWDDCRKSYANHMNKEGDPLDPVLLHNFTAEGRSVDFERQLADEGNDYRSLHPRVVMLLEDPIALQQFIYLGIFGKISGNEVRNVYRWELNWERKAGAETIWLTRGWNEVTDKVQRPNRPNILHAMHGYVIRKRTYEPGRTTQIESEFARRYIDEELKKIGLKGERKMIEDNLEGGFVGWLKEMAFDPEGNKIINQDFDDMANVIRLMLTARLESLKQRPTPVNQGGGNSGPFKVYRPQPSQENPSENDSVEEDEEDSSSKRSTPWQNR